MARVKPDCTGQRFGMLTVLGKGGKTKRFHKGRRRETLRQLWRLQCDCGKIIECLRGDFENSGQVSCGCKRKRGLVDNKKRPVDITGQKFGTLTAIKLSGCRNQIGRLNWIMQCDCGMAPLRCLTELRSAQRLGIRINCGDALRHIDRWLHYPPMPVPCPVEVGELLQKYLHLTTVKYDFVDAEVEDEMRDRLLRTCWIITYRRNQGESISIAHERNLIQKNIRYSALVINHKRIEAQNLDRVYTNSNRNIGSKMTDVTSNNYPVIQTQGISLLPILQNSVVPDLLSRFCARKRLKFKRC